MSGNIYKPEISELSRIRDRISFLFIEKGKITKDSNALLITDEEGETVIPPSAFLVLMLGPGTSITQRAVQTAAESGMQIVWCGEGGTRFYAGGRALNGNTDLLLRQADVVSNTQKRISAARRMYGLRFPDAGLSKMHIKAMLGAEGTRMQEVYRRYAEEYRVRWDGRVYDVNDYFAGDDINRAISSANACMYGICRAVIFALGLSPGLGIIHSGNEESFVHDIADLYKADISIRTAFQIVSEGSGNLEQEVRTRLRDRFKEAKLPQKIVQDIFYVLQEDKNEEKEDEYSSGNRLWSGGNTENYKDGGVNYGSGDTQQSPAEA